jgi:hypothetical protein
LPALARDEPSWRVWESNPPVSDYEPVQHDRCCYPL